MSTDAGDAALILGEEGWIVPVGDMVGLATQWSKFFLLSDGERRLYSERARCRVMGMFEIDLVVRRYEAIYRDAMKRRHEKN